MPVYAYKWYLQLQIDCGLNDLPGARSIDMAHASLRSLKERILAPLEVGVLTLQLSCHYLIWVRQGHPLTATVVYSTTTAAGSNQPCSCQACSMQCRLAAEVLVADVALRVVDHDICSSRQRHCFDGGAQICINLQRNSGMCLEHIIVRDDDHFGIKEHKQLPRRRKHATVRQVGTLLAECELLQSIVTTLNVCASHMVHFVCVPHFRAGG